IARFKAVKDRPNDNLLPSELMVLDSKQAYVILVDTSRSRLFLYENSFPHPRLVTDFYVSQGKRGAVKNREGDKRTPVGVYTITELLPKEKLTDFYGPIALPIDYPNAWDKRLGKTGYGIWLHGMPDEYVSRPPKDSDGCVVLANQDLLALQPFVDIGNTLVVISEKLDFVPADLWQVQRRAALRVVKSWKDDLEQSVESGIKHYAQNVLINGEDLISWQKNLDLTDRSFGSINLDNLNVLQYPNPEGDMMRITFDREDAITGRTRVEQFWMKIGTRWKIVQEQTQNS
ncbi:MAG: L,D-transpeptidase, partial [Limnobacter sp.]|nr:L,D-transpeptidase [Limnobacter sp.]